MNLFKYLVAAAVLLPAAHALAQSWCSNNTVPIQMSAGASAVASIYPSTITVADAPASITELSIAINGLSHTYPDDVEMLLVGPGGQKMVIQSDTGGNPDVSGVSYVLSDAAAGPLPDSTEIVVGTYKPADFVGDGNYYLPAPAGPYNLPAPMGAATFAAVFGGTNPNGTWSLYVQDDSNSDGGQLASWCLRLGAPLKISEFRLRGPNPNSTSNEFIEIHNDSPTPTLVSSPASAGFAIAASDGLTRCVIPNGTLIPAGGHYLCTNSIGYSLGGYPAGTGGTVASGNATYTTEIPDNTGIALFNTSNPALFNPSTRLDAVGSASEMNTLYKEGTGYPTLSPLLMDYSYHRDLCGKRGNVSASGPCVDRGFARDTNNNAQDFVFVDANGTSAGAGQRLGAPAPQNLNSPVSGSLRIPTRGIDTCSDRLAGQNLFRNPTSLPQLNSLFGQIDIRRTITNNTGVPITRLRYRIAEISTFPAPAGYADLRAITSDNTTVIVDRPPCGSGNSAITAYGTTLEQPPSQLNGGAFNSTFNIPLATELAPGASIDVNFRFGVQQTGEYKVDLVPESLPLGASRLDVMHIEGCANVPNDGPCADVIFRHGSEP